MDGSEFLALASRLAVGLSEAEHRTSISRGYYGVFHLACGLVNRCGVQLPRTADAHNKVHWCLGQSGNAELALAANMLASLRTARNTADYDLDASVFHKPAYILQQLKIAEQIAAIISASETNNGFDKVRDAIRRYAEETLRLQVARV